MEKWGQSRFIHEPTNPKINKSTLTPLFARRCREKVACSPFRCLKINARSLGSHPAMHLSYVLRRVSPACAGPSLAIFLSFLLGIDPAI